MSTHRSRPSESKAPVATNILETAFASRPGDCRDVDLLVIGGGLGLDFAWQVAQRATGKSQPGPSPRIAVMEAGRLDLLSHLGNTGLARIGVLRQGTERVGGKTVLWGLSTPRPPQAALRRWDRPYDELVERFDHFEDDMGVTQVPPLADRELEHLLRDLLQKDVDDRTILQAERAPLAISAHGHRWSAIDRLAELLDHGVRIVPQTRCTRLVIRQGRIDAVHGVCRGRPFVCHPRFVALAVGVEPALQLLSESMPESADWQPADHIRIDLHGWLEPDHFGVSSADDLGIAVLYVAAQGREASLPYHLEVKVAPKRHWARYMPSGDNLRTLRDDPRILVQVQAIAQMHHRLSVGSLVRIMQPIHNHMTLSDVRFHAEIAEQMDRVARRVGVENGPLTMRPLLENHHLYGLLRVGRGLAPDLSLKAAPNLFVLAPTGFVDVDDDANPVLKSRVLNSYAADTVARHFWPAAPGANASFTPTPLTAALTSANL